MDLSRSQIGTMNLGHTMPYQSIICTLLRLSDFSQLFSLLNRNGITESWFKELSEIDRVAYADIIKLLDGSYMSFYIQKAPTLGISGACTGHGRWFDA